MQFKHGVHAGAVFSFAGASLLISARPTVFCVSVFGSTFACATAPALSLFSLTIGALVEKPSSVLSPHTSCTCASVGAAQSASESGLNVFGFGSLTFFVAGSRR